MNDRYVEKDIFAGIQYLDIRIHFSSSTIPASLSIEFSQSTAQHSLAVDYSIEN